MQSFANNAFQRPEQGVPIARLGLLAMVCLLALACLAGCDEKQSGAAATPPPVQVGVMTLHPQSVVLTTELPGRTTASLVAEVRPQVEGIIRERLFREGGEVQAGDVLYRVEQSTYKAGYASASAALRKAQAALPSSESKAKRYAELYKQGAISEQEYQDATATYQADLAAVASARAQLDTAQISLGYTEIKAPISGRVEKSNLTPGALVTANQSSPLTTIRCLDPINVDLTQSSSSFLDLRQAIASGDISTEGTSMTVKLKLENGTLYPYEGTVEFSEAKVDENTGTYTVRAEFPNPDRLLLPGMYVRAIIRDGMVNDCFLVPQRAVSRTPRGEPSALFVSKDGKVEQRILKVRKNVGNSWMVDSGLMDGDLLIVEGTQFIRAGQAVTTREMIVDDATGEVRPMQAEQGGTSDAAPAAAQQEG